jgi:hypothetical protein
VHGVPGSRYESAEELQNLSGIAPVTVQSGRSRRVQRRRACPKFLRQTFHEIADHARRWSWWSRARHEQKRAAGMKQQAAVRPLAYKWIRIIFRLWTVDPGPRCACPGLSSGRLSDAAQC